MKLKEQLPTESEQVTFDFHNNSHGIVFKLINK